ncbi:hypothetical protein ABD91_21495 [Lysinibacillus sphaericus]|uniref:hypothetical protein n=1 Tax=Lysinibacillus sphaericus TaxID=1421 RepID=UPI0018CE84EC|nr:hypothetical protein [Lysinibacillus sphaericus]MBG9693313.1 hypothetical protein [Lysinibacillus sphaericus]
MNELLDRLKLPGEIISNAARGLMKKREGAAYEVTTRLMIDLEQQMSYVVHILIGFNDVAFEKRFKKMIKELDLGIHQDFYYQEVGTFFKPKQELRLKLDVFQNRKSAIVKSVVAEVATFGIIELNLASTTFSLKGIANQKFKFINRDRAELFMEKMGIVLNGLLEHEYEIYAKLVSEIKAESNRSLN